METMTIIEWCVVKLSSIKAILITDSTDTHSFTYAENGTFLSLYHF